MLTFTNTTTKETYQNNKKYMRFESVPNTAAGYERCRCYIYSHGSKYFLSAENEKDYFLWYSDDNGEKDSFHVRFTVDGDTITINNASYKQRYEKANKFLKKYMMVVAMAHSCIKYDRIVEYIRYTA